MTTNYKMKSVLHNWEMKYKACLITFFSHQALSTSSSALTQCYSHNTAAKYSCAHKLILINIHPPRKFFFPLKVMTVLQLCHLMTEKCIIISCTSLWFNINYTVILLEILGFIEVQKNALYKTDFTALKTRVVELTFLVLTMSLKRKLCSTSLISTPPPTHQLRHIHF